MSLSNIYLSTPGIPPTPCRSSIEYLPLGFKSANNGVLSLILLKSSKVKSILAAFAIAKKCNTALVDPPNTVTNLNAFSNDSLVTISDGLISFSNSNLIASPALTDSCPFKLPSLTAGLEELKGKDIPNASIAEAIVLAVYIPPHAPAPGHALCTTSLNSASSIVPATFCPKASKAEIISNFLPLWHPDAIVPPYTKIQGLFKRNIAIKAPGIFLSQPTTVTKPS